MPPASLHPETNQTEANQTEANRTGASCRETLAQAAQKRRFDQRSCARRSVTRNVGANVLWAAHILCWTQKTLFLPTADR